MAIPSNKPELLEAIQTTYERLRSEFPEINPAAAAESTMEGHAKGTKMSVCNLLAYLIGWGELVLKWNRRLEAGKEVDWPETGFKWTELGGLAQKFYQDYEALNFPELQQKLDEVVVEISQLIESTPERKLYGGDPWYKHYPMGRMIQLNTSSPYKNARTRLRNWKRQQK